MGESAPFVMETSSGNAIGGSDPHWAQRWVLAACVCWVLFVNHYARDVTGALEREIEADLNLSVSQFQTLNSAYFAPNLVMPFLMGLVAQRIGASRMLIISSKIAIVGHCAVAVGGQRRLYSLLLAGRVILGLTYESIDVMPLPILGPLFSDSWGLMVGLFNAFLRSGSVSNFVVTPAVYNLFGLGATLWVSAAVGASGCVAAVFAHSLEKRLKAAAMGASAGGCEGQRVEDGDARTEEVAGRSRGAIKSFWIYVAVGASMYASIVPFWFYGGAFIRAKWNYSLEAADALMLFPEGGMVVLSPPIGIIVDGRLRSVSRRLVSLSICLVVVIFGFCTLGLLSASALTPIVPLGLLGAGYAASNTLFWSLSDRAVPKEYYAIGSGVIGSGLNLGASTLPLIMAQLENGGAALMLLASAAMMAAAGAILLLWTWPRPPPALLSASSRDPAFVVQT